MRMKKALRGLVVLFTVGILIPSTVSAQQPPRPDSTDLVFEREVFNYPSFDRRDPFIRVVSGSEGGPRFEEIQLIGVIFSPNPDLSVALFGPRGGGEGGPAAGGQTRSRRTFRARLGDQLGNVRILEIQQTRVVVEVEEFGLTEQRIMELPRPGEGGSQ
jgi:hypothetical protein